MSLLTPKPEGGIVSKGMREHIDKMLTVCPLCGSHEPVWKIHYRVDLLDGRIQFCCSKCSSAFSITQTDMIGVNKLKKSKTPLTHLYTWQLTAGEAVKKKLKGKDFDTVYVMIDKLGFVDDPPFQKGQEVPLPEIQEVARRLG